MTSLRLSLACLSLVACEALSPEAGPIAPDDRAQAPPSDEEAPRKQPAPRDERPQPDATGAGTRADGAEDAEAIHPAAPPAPAGPCPADMVEVGTFCIDRYEAPNVAGEKPLLMQSAHDGEAWCQERGKRLCLEREWVRACGGPNGHNFPYGLRYQRSVCNDDKRYRVPRWAALRSFPSEAAKAEVARLDQSEPSGSREGCVSAEGVFDLTGNVAEWVVRTEDNPTNHGHVVKGCYWNQCFRPPHGPACDYVNYAHQGAERSYEMGFRCCRDRDAG